MKSFRRILWVLLSFSSGTAIVLALLFVPTSSDQPPLRFACEPFIVPGDLPPNSAQRIEAELVNDANSDAHLVGALEFCGSACYQAEGLPLTIPAKGRAKVVIHLFVSDPGPVSDHMTFYTDRRSQPTLKLEVQANVADIPSDAYSKVPQLVP